MRAHACMAGTMSAQNGCRHLHIHFFIPETAWLKNEGVERHEHECVGGRLLAVATGKKYGGKPFTFITQTEYSAAVA